MGGPAYSTANGSCIEGDRMMVALMRMPAGTARKPTHIRTSSGSTSWKERSATVGGKR